MKTNKHKTQDENKQTQKHTTQKTKKINMDPTQNRSGPDPKQEWTRPKTRVDPTQNRSGPDSKQEWTRPKTGVDPTQNRSGSDPKQEWTHGFAKCKQFLSRIRHPPSYSYIAKLNPTILLIPY